MKRNEGMHFYINISNFDDVIENEELESGSVNHSIHALNTYFSAIEWFGKNKYGNKFVVEKITGARLHMYILDNISGSFLIAKDVSVYAYRLAAFMNNEVAKYKKLISFGIQIGICHGHFYDFVFKDEGYEEETSIGFAANYAAKLQILSEEAHISIASSVYEELDVNDATVFLKKHNVKIEKYEQYCYYTAPIAALPVDGYTYKEELNHAFEIVQKTNLADMNNEAAYVKISMENLSIKTIKKVTGIPLFADVRNFTQQFDKEDANLLEMADKTQKILRTMYSVIKDKGVHVQFQGDREFALFHNYSDQECAVDAGKYFTINRARQYGKTTSLALLRNRSANTGITSGLLQVTCSISIFIRIKSQVLNGYK